MLSALMMAPYAYCDSSDGKDGDFSGCTQISTVFYPSTYTLPQGSPYYYSWNYYQELYDRNNYTQYACPSDPFEQEPELCSNGVWDVDEDGIDCGGICSDQCDQLSCFSPYESWQDIDTGELICVAWYDADDYGNCPPGTKSYSDFYGENSGTGKDCVAFQPDYGGGYGSPVPTSSNDDQPEEDEASAPTPYYPDTYTETSTSDTTTTDNGDGTTTTTTTTTTGSDGTGTTTTTTTTDNGDGTRTTTTTTDETIPEEENPDNYDYTVDDKSDEYDSDITDQLPEEKDINTLLSVFDNALPYAAIITGSEIQTSGATCSMTFDYHGHTIEFGFCSDAATNTFNFMAPIITFCATLAGILVIFGKD